MATRKLLVKAKELSMATGLNTEWWRDQRLRGNLPSACFEVINARTIRYNPDLCLAWLRNRNDPQGWELALNNYLAGLPENQPKKRRSKSA